MKRPWLILLVLAAPAAIASAQAIQVDTIDGGGGRGAGGSLLLDASIPPFGLAGDIKASSNGFQTLTPGYVPALAASIPRKNSVEIHWLELAELETAPLAAPIPRLSPGARRSVAPIPVAAIHSPHQPF